MKKLLGQFAFGSLIGGIFLFIILRQIDFKSFWISIQQARHIYLLPAALVFILAYAARTFRWRNVFPVLKASPFIKVSSYVIIGYFMNSILPLRLGEIVRAHLAGKRLNFSRSSILATIVIERMFDSIFYLVIFSVIIVFLPFPEWAKKAYAVAFITSTLFLGTVLFLAHNQELFHKLLSKLPIPKKIGTFIENFSSNFFLGLKIMKNFRGIATVFIFTALVWLMEVLVFYFVGLSYGLELSVMKCFFVMVIIGTAAIIPPAPGFVGTFEFFGVLALSFFGIEKNIAFAMIITVHLIQLFMIFIMGLRVVITEKISFSDVLSILKRKESASI